MNWFARRFKYTRSIEDAILIQKAHLDHCEKVMTEQMLQLVEFNRVVGDLRELLPGEKKPQEPIKVLEIFAERAVIDLGTLMAACVDYRNLLIRADVPDSVSGRHEGVERIFARYGVVLERRKDSIRGMWSAYMDSIASDQTDLNYTYETRTRKISDHSE